MFGCHSHCSECVWTWMCARVQHKKSHRPSNSAEVIVPTAPAPTPPPQPGMCARLPACAFGCVCECAPDVPSCCSGCPCARDLHVWLVPPALCGCAPAPAPCLRDRRRTPPHRACATPKGTRTTGSSLCVLVAPCVNRVCVVRRHGRNCVWLFWCVCVHACVFVCGVLGGGGRAQIQAE